MPDNKNKNKNKIKLKDIKPSKGYSDIDDRIFNAVSGESYSSFLASLQSLGRIRRGEKYTPGVDIKDPYFDEIFKYSLGHGNVEDMELWEESPYKPSVSSDKNSSYLRLKDIDKQRLLQSQGEFINDTSKQVNIVRPTGTLKSKHSVTKSSQLSNDGDPWKTLGYYKISKGEDEKGKYISIYDKWDLNYKKANKFLDRKPEIYDRVYYTEHSYNGKKYEKIINESPNIMKKNINEVPEMSLGGILADTAMGAGSGALMGGGALSVPGALIGGGVGLIKGLGSHFKEKKMDRLEDERANSAHTQWAMGIQGNQQIYNPYTATFEYGGQIGEANVELEKQEVFQTPDGQTGQVDAPSHEQGGIKMNLPEGTRVWSDDLKTINGKTFADEAASIEKEIAKYQKKLK